MWEDYRNGLPGSGWDIYGYNLATGEEFPVTTYSDDQFCPVICGDIVVWQDDRHGNWDIYGYNLATQEEFQIAGTPRIEVHPAIYKDVVVWVDKSGKENHFDIKDDIYGHNSVKKKEFRITADESDAELPAIYENIVIWMDFRNNNMDIYGYCLPPSISQTQEAVSEKEEKPGEGEGGICAGTLFVFLVLVGGLSRELKGK